MQQSTKMAIIEYAFSEDRRKCILRLIFILSLLIFLVLSFFNLLLSILNLCNSN